MRLAVRVYLAGLFVLEGAERVPRDALAAGALGLYSTVAALAHRLA